MTVPRTLGRGIGLRNSTPVRLSSASFAGAKLGGGGGGGGGGENLEKVRDILFGAQMRDQDRRFGRLEERLAKDLADVREETKARLESLEAYLKKEVQSLVDRLKNESSQRGDAIKAVSQE